MHPQLMQYPYLQERSDRKFYKIIASTNRFFSTFSFTSVLSAVTTIVYIFCSPSIYSMSLKLFCIHILSNFMHFLSIIWKMIAMKSSSVFPGSVLISNDAEKACRISNEFFWSLMHCSHFARVITTLVLRRMAFNISNRLQNFKGHDW